MVINLNPATLTNPSGTVNVMGIIEHAVFQGKVYLHVICAGDQGPKWITLEEAYLFCPTGVMIYTQLQVSQAYGVSLDELFESD